MSAAPPSKPSYSKPWISFADQVAKLKSCGLIVPDEPFAEAFLSHSSYYRFSGYCLAFESSRHVFLPNVSFDDIRNAYTFDQTLRDHLTDALEIIEVDFRTQIAYWFGERHGAFGHVDPSNFDGRFDHAEWLRRIHDETDRSSELFVEHFKRKYREHPDLPVWMLMEIMSMGTVTRMFRNMLRDDQKTIAHRYTVQPFTLGSIMLHFQYVRNLCAHHARVWDKVWTIKPELPKANDWLPPKVPGNDRLYATLLLLYYFLKRCPTMTLFARTWRDKLHAFLDQPPNTPNALSLMGIPANWKQNLLWR